MFTTSSSSLLVAALAPLLLPLLLAPAPASAQCVDTPLNITNPTYAVEPWAGATAAFTASTSSWSIAANNSNAYIAVHFNAAKCADLSAFKGLSFDAVVPAGGSFTVSWTARQADCTTKVSGQSYISAAPFISATGKVSIPFSSFSTYLNATTLPYIEDFTLIGFNPASGWTVSNFTLSCTVAASVSTTAAANTASATAAAAAETVSATPAAKSAADKNVARWLLSAVVAVVVFGIAL